MNPTMIPSAEWSPIGIMPVRTSNRDQDHRHCHAPKLCCNLSYLGSSLVKNNTVGQQWVPRRVQGTKGESEPDVPVEDPKQGILGHSARGLADGAGLKQAEARGPGAKAKGPEKALFPWPGCCPRESCGA